ncbi:MAG TPA: carboxypeptidase-like regulatory domain-containing protein, partial [Pyrinomonadaceae bacterium]|nr:carboxypeptidase-like regulatory domain-containing protein [Pyrinomonadaceae bacterium]
MTKITRLVFNFFGAVLLLSISTVAGFAQTSGEMSGLVTDPSGAAVSGANVTITNKATAATRNVTTNSEGL